MLKSLAFALLLTTAAPVLAQADAAASAVQSAKAKDPNRKICEVVEQIGTRLGAKRICMTAREWEEQRRTQRLDVERVQQGVNQRPNG